MTRRRTATSHRVPPRHPDMPSIPQDGVGLLDANNQVSMLYVGPQVDQLIRGRDGQYYGVGVDYWTGSGIIHSIFRLRLLPEAPTPSRSACGRGTVLRKRS